MVVYLDTSSLVKLYVEEKGSSEVAAVVENARVVATSIIAYVEARAVFARRFKERSIVKKEYNMLLMSFETDWVNYLQIKVSQNVVQLAGNLAAKHALRGFDAIHLSSAIYLMNSKMPVLFLCHDDKLQKASLREKLIQPNPR
jgi:uncharacterized protein